MAGICLVSFPRTYEQSRIERFEKRKMGREIREGGKK